MLSYRRGKYKAEALSCKVGEKDAVLFKISRDAGVFSKAIDLLFAK
jgi:hypothetical protein